MKFRSYVEPPEPIGRCSEVGGVQHCHGRGRPGQFHPGRPVHVQPVPRTVFVGTVRRSLIGPGNRRRAPLQAYLLRALNGGRTCESAMPAFQARLRAVRAPLAAAASTGRWSREFDERPFSARSRMRLV